MNSWALIRAVRSSQIDFQISIYATPVIDLTYVLYMIAHDEVRLNHRAELLKTYHEEFVATLNQLGYLKKPPTLLDLNLEFLEHGMMGISIECI